MSTTVEVRFKGNRKDYFLWPDEAEPLHLRDAVIVEAERGLDLGRVGSTGEAAAKKCAGGCHGCALGETPTAQRHVLRIARQDEVHSVNELRRAEEDTRRKAIERVRHYGLEMKVSDAEWQWDRKKLTLYFTADKRVDFRELVRDLASTFKTRIELRQIGVRDEAARLGGVGRCGKEYCCSSWLRELSPISLSLAKDQHLSLNPAQISGGCGRLLCCLKYEHEFYVTQRKRFPKEGKLVRTTRGAEKVVAVDIFRERVFLRSEEQGPRTVLLADLQEELVQLGESLPSPEAGAVRPPAPAPAAPAVASTSSAAPAADAAAPAEPGHTSEGKKRSRRRRRRGSRPSDPSPPSPPGPPPEPDS